MYKRLFIFVEGPDDDRFFNKIVKGLFKDRYNEIEILEYSRKTGEYINNFLKNIGKMGAEYICQSDLDEVPCATERKEKLKERFSGFEENRIIVVKIEIESWYLALLDDDACRKLRIKPSEIRNTDHINKENFNSLIPKRFDSRVDFMVEILNCASIETAMQRNTSFKYFIDNIDKYCS
jgi:hypothetical protein